MVAVKRIIYYLLGTCNHRLFYKVGFSLTLQAYSNTDWARCSVSILYVGNTLVRWKCKKYRREYLNLLPKLNIELYHRLVLKLFGFDDFSFYHSFDSPKKQNTEVDCHSLYLILPTLIIHYLISTEFQPVNIFTNSLSKTRHQLWLTNWCLLIQQ